MQVNNIVNELWKRILWTAPKKLKKDLEFTPFHPIDQKSSILIDGKVYAAGFFFVVRNEQNGELMRRDTVFDVIGKTNFKLVFLVKFCFSG